MKGSGKGQVDLFGAPAPALPEGMIYQTGFLTAEEEAALVRLAASLPLEEMNYRGFTARRRVASYGGQYDVVGVSLLGEAIMRFRPYPPREPKKAGVIKLVVEPRSIYLLQGPARWAWQHSVAPTRTLRYSITFRTARRPAGG